MVEGGEKKTKEEYFVTLTLCEIQISVSISSHIRTWLRSLVYSLSQSALYYNCRWNGPRSLKFVLSDTWRKQVGWPPIQPWCLNPRVTHSQPWPNPMATSMSSSSLIQCDQRFYFVFSFYILLQLKLTLLRVLVFLFLLCFLLCLNFLQ